MVYSSEIEKNISGENGVGKTERTGSSYLRLRSMFLLTAAERVLVAEASDCVCGLRYSRACGRCIAVQLKK